MAHYSSLLMLRCLIKLLLIRKFRAAAAAAAVVVVVVVERVSSSLSFDIPPCSFFLSYLLTPICLVLMTGKKIGSWYQLSIIPAHGIRFRSCYI